MAEAYSFTCSDRHEEIGFKVKPPNGLTACPLCLLRTEVLLELAQPRTSYERFGLELSSLALRSYPYHAEGE